MEIASKSRELADALLHPQKGAKEVKVTHHIKDILDEYEIENQMEYPAGPGRVDIYAPRHRLIVEAKRPHTHSLLDHKPQLDGYAKILAQDEVQMLRFDDSETCDFTGILTDGRVWNVWRYHAETGFPIKVIRENFMPSDGMIFYVS